MFFPRITDKQQQHGIDKQERILLVDALLISFHIFPTLCLLAAMGLARWTELLAAGIYDISKGSCTGSICSRYFSLKNTWFLV